MEKEKCVTGEMFDGNTQDFPVDKEELISDSGCRIWCISIRQTFLIRTRKCCLLLVNSSLSQHHLLILLVGFFFKVFVRIQLTAVSDSAKAEQAMSQASV